MTNSKKHLIIAALAAIGLGLSGAASANGAGGFTGSLSTLGAISLSGSAAGTQGGASSTGNGYGYVNSGAQGDSTAGFHATLDGTHMNVDGYTTSGGAGMTEVRTKGNGIAGGNYAAGGLGFEAGGALGITGGYQPTGNGYGGNHGHNGHGHGYDN